MSLDSQQWSSVSSDLHRIYHFELFDSLSQNARAARDAHLFIELVAKEASKPKGQHSGDGSVRRRWWALLRWSSASSFKLCARLRGGRLRGAGKREDGSGVLRLDLVIFGDAFTFVQSRARVRACSVLEWTLMHSYKALALLQLCKLFRLRALVCVVSHLTDHPPQCL